MTPSATSTTFLDSLKDPANETAWKRFDRRYRVMLMSVADRLGLQTCDAEDAVQRTLLAFRQRYSQGDYDAQKGRLRDWLCGIARFEIADIHADRARQPQPAGSRSHVERKLRDLPDPEGFSALWEKEWGAHILHHCFALARECFSPRDIQIFDRLTIQGQDIADVANQVDLSPDAIRQIKHRVLKYMRSVQAELSEWE